MVTRLVVRGAVWAGCLVVGAAAALAAVLLHQRWWGLLLGLAAAAAYAVALPGGPARLAFALGWGGVVVRAALQRPEGDFLVGADASGYALLLGAPVLVLFAVATLLPGRGRGVPPAAVQPAGAPARLG